MKLVPVFLVVADDAPEDYDAVDDIGVLLSDFHETRRGMWDDDTPLYVVDVTPRAD